MSDVISDDQVIEALDRKRQEILNSDMSRDFNTESIWAFRHLLTVIDHTKKIFTLKQSELHNIKQVLSKES